MEKGVAPYVDKSEDLGLSRSSWGWETGSTTSTTTACSRPCRRPVSSRAKSTAGPSCTSWRWATTPSCARPATAGLPARRRPFRPSARPLLRPFGFRPYFDLAADLGLGDPHVTRGIATADVDGDGRLDYAIADQWETSWFFHNQSRKAGAALDLALEIPVESMAGTLVLPGNTPGSPRPGTWPGRRSGPPPPSACRTAATGRQVDGGNGHSGKRSPEITSASAGWRPERCCRSTRLARCARGGAPSDLRLPPGRHTVLLGEARERGQTIMLSRNPTSGSPPCAASHRDHGVQPPRPHDFRLRAVVGAALRRRRHAYAAEILFELLFAWSTGSQDRRPRFLGGPVKAIDFLLPAHITGLAISMLLYANDRLLPLVFATTAAIASKHLFRVRVGNAAATSSTRRPGITATPPLLPWVGIAQPYMFTENLTGAGKWILPASSSSGSFLNFRFTTRCRSSPAGSPLRSPGDRPLPGLRHPLVPSSCR